MQVATVSPSPSGPAPQAAPAASANPGSAIATFVSLLSLLLGPATAAEQPLHDSAADLIDAPGSVTNSNKNKGGVEQSKSQQSKSQQGKSQEKAVSNGVLIGLSPLPGCTPTALPAGVTGVSKETDQTETSARSHNSGREQEKDTDSEQAATAPVAQVAIAAAPAIPAIAAPVSTAPVSTAPVSTPPVAASQPGESTASRGIAVAVDPPPAHAALLPVAVSQPAARPAPNTPEPPVAFVLELKPAGPALPAQSLPVTNVVDHKASPAANTTAPMDAPAAAPVIAKADVRGGNQNSNSSDTGRDRHTSTQGTRPPRREDPIAAAGDTNSVETILKPVGAAPAPASERPTIQREAFTEAPVAAEPIARANEIAPPEQPKQAAVREISFQSTSPDAGAVKVQLIDRGGDIRISVRSSDPNLTHALQRDVGQLVTKLDHAGYETKVWNPRDTSPLTAAPGVRDIEIRPEAGSGNNASPDPGSRGNQGGGQEHPQQQRRQGDVRQWANALNESARGAITDDEEGLWQ
jgi:hypothetical protein